MKTTQAHQSGFTLVELLISLGILSLLLTAVVSVNIGTSRSAAGLQARNDLQPELQLAQNYMASKLSQASYVFPVGDNVQMTSSGDTTKNYVSLNYNWKVGTHPIVAFIIPPKIVTVGGCQSAATSPSPTNQVSDKCYAFYAFYIMRRDNYLAAVLGSGADNPGPSPTNDTTAWVLMEYRGYYTTPAAYGGNGYSQATTDIPTGNRGRLLMDFLPSYAGTTDTAATVKLFDALPTTSSQAAGSTTVTMNLAALQNVAQQIIRVPAGTITTYNTLTVYPRNVGKTQLIN